MAHTLLPLIYLLVFVAAVLAAQATASLLFVSRDRKHSINRRLAMLESGMNPEDVYSALIKRPKAPFLLRGRLSELHDKAWIFCRQAGLSITPARLAVFVACASGGLWLVVLLFSRHASLFGFVLNGTVSLLASIAFTSLIAWVYIDWRRKRLLRALERQMPLALDVINRAIRAGHPVVAAVQLAAQEMGDPIGSEFGLIVDETTYGLAFKDALANFADRSGSPDAHFFAVSVSIQSETGGNLAEILAGLASVIRGRATLSKRVKALSSEGRASALLLSVLPGFVIAFLLLVHPTFYTSKFSDPIFWPTVAGVAGLYVVGWIMIRRIINFRY
jgi:tight adherence protein B